MSWKSILKPETSVVSGIATLGLVFAIYQANVGSMAQAQATAANHPVLESSRKKAGYQAFAVVAALTLVTRDANIGILGWGGIIAMELVARHSIMANPESGQIQNPDGNSAYAPAENVVPMWQQGQAS